MERTLTIFRAEVKDGYSGNGNATPLNAVRLETVTTEHQLRVLNAKPAAGGRPFWRGIATWSHTCTQNVAILLVVFRENRSLIIKVSSHGVKACPLELILGLCFPVTHP